MVQGHIYIDSGIDLWNITGDTSGWHFLPGRHYPCQVFQVELDGGCEDVTVVYSRLHVPPTQPVLLYLQAYAALWLWDWLKREHRIIFTQSTSIVYPFKQTLAWIKVPICSSEKITCFRHFTFPPSMYWHTSFCTTGWELRSSWVRKLRQKPCRRYSTAT